MPAHKAKQPEPLVIRVTVGGVIGGLSAACMHFGALHGAGHWLAANKDFLAAGALGLGPTVGAILARWHVTPTAAPRDEEGARLAPELEALPSTSSALAAADAIHSMAQK